MKSALSLLLAVSVFSCPLLCHVGHVAAGTHIVGAACCCHPQPAGGPSKGNPNRPQKSDGCCQGVCGGAVFNHAPSVQSTVDTDWSVPVVVVQPISLFTLHETEFNRFGAAPWP